MKKKIVVIVLFFANYMMLAIEEKHWQRAYPLKDCVKMQKNGMSPLMSLKRAAQAGDLISMRCLNEWRKLYSIPHYCITHPLIKKKLYKLSLIEKNGKFPLQLQKVLYLTKEGVQTVKGILS